MPSTTAPDGTSLFYRTDGEGPTVVFVGEAGYGAWQWAWQAPRVAGPFESVVWDLRGTGRSDAPQGPHDVETLAGDLDAVLQAVEARRVHLVGAGLGGMVALHYARSAGRVASLSLFGTAAEGDAVDERAYRALYPERTDTESLRASLDGALTPAFRAESDLVEQLSAWRREEDAGPAAVDDQIAAALAFEAEPLHELAVPALVCHGLGDPVVPVEAGKRLAKDLPRGTFEAVEGRHLCFVEHSRAVTDRLLAFLRDVESA